MVNGDERTASEDGKGRLELQTWSDLPLELLELILCNLTFEDNVRASVVCKRWHKVAISVRVMNQSPWLMYIPKSGCLYEFYDPSERKIHSLELPELRGCRVCYTKQGWLLLYRRRNHLVFFFNPFTRETINLPSYELAYEIMAFSCAPTSTNCVVFSIKHVHPTVVAISTCHPGASEWTIINHRNRLPFVSSIWDKPVFCGGLFYCLSLTGWLGVYDPGRRYWKVLAVPPPRCPENFFVKNWWKGKFMTEHNGDLLVVYTSQNKNPMIYKLYRSELAWKEMESLRGVTIFSSFLSSLSGANLPGIMRNNTIPVNSSMTGESNLPLRTYGSSHPAMPYPLSERSDLLYDVHSGLSLGDFGACINGGVGSSTQ
ncbi:hypothetical protein Gogos_009318, partial [Gossypium gossypioides]|nr:hypothetical protein [Gossypium gossypioides]